MNKMKSQKLLGFILLLVVFLAAFAFLGRITGLFSPLKRRVRRKIQLPIKRPMVVKSSATSLLSFSPPMVSLKSKEEFKIKVVVDAQENNLSAAELYILYNPNILKVKQVKPGDFFENPKILLQEVDLEKGEIAFALGTFSPKKGESGFLAEIILEAKPVVEKTTTFLKFSPETKLADIEQEETVLKATKPAKLTILP